MAIEIERKFLVRDDSWRASAEQASRIRQAYIANNDLVSIRVRLVDAARAVLTIKSAKRGLVRREFEYEIPVAEAEDLFELREGAAIEKTRYIVPVGGQVWEVDVFAGDNEGLILAELELEHAAQSIDRPAWLGREVTADKRFYNAVLTRRPYRTWAAAGDEAPST
jgi:adenylate cyclase